MPWFFNVQRTSRTRPHRYGPFASQADADEQKAAYEANPAEQGETVSDPYETNEEAPVAFAKFVNTEGETQVWTDGSTGDKND